MHHRKINVTDPAIAKWELELNVKLDDIWKEIRLYPFQITLCTKLRYFQYRILSNRLTTNVKRKMYNPDISDICFFCSRHRETVIHIMWECKEVKKTMESIF